MGLCRVIRLKKVKVLKSTGMGHRAKFVILAFKKYTFCQGLLVYSTREVKKSLAHDL